MIKEKLNPTYKYMAFMRIKHLLNSKPGDRYYWEPDAF